MMTENEARRQNMKNHAISKRETIQNAYNAMRYLSADHAKIVSKMLKNPYKAAGILDCVMADYEMECDKFVARMESKVA